MDKNNHIHLKINCALLVGTMSARMLSKYLYIDFSFEKLDKVKSTFWLFHLCNDENIVKILWR